MHEMKRLLNHTQFTPGASLVFKEIMMFLNQNHNFQSKIYKIISHSDIKNQLSYSIIKYILEKCTKWKDSHSIEILQLAHDFIA